jgi:hypothetical protein
MLFSKIIPIYRDSVDKCLLNGRTAFVLPSNVKLCKELTVVLKIATRWQTGELDEYRWKHTVQTSWCALTADM